MLFDIPSGFFLTNYHDIKVYGAICFILGWLCRAITDLIIQKIIIWKKNKERQASQEPGQEA